MVNRFVNCKTLEDLYKMFEEHADKILEFTNLSTEELTTVKSVFNSNVDKGDKVDDEDEINENAYTYIWNFTIDFIENSMVKDQEYADNETMKSYEGFKKMMEESNMENKKRGFKGTINSAINGIKKAASSAKVELGDDKESFINRCNDAIDEIKNHMAPVLEVLDDALGCSALKDEICAIMYDSLNGSKSSNGFFKMADKCRDAIKRTINILAITDPDDKFGSVAFLRATIGEYDDGEKVVLTQNIWMAFAKSIVWVCKKVARKLRKWFGVDAEENILGATGAAIAAVFAKIGKVAVNIAKIAGTALSYVASYAVAGAIKLTQLAITAIKYVVSKIKGWYTAAKDKLTKEDEDDDDLFEEEADGVFGTNLA